MLPTLITASAHHLLAFLLIAILAAELTLVRTGMTLADRKRLGALDAAYGLVALVLLGLGLWRAASFEKGLEYYLASPWFWLKIGAFLLVAALSVPPTLRFRAWGKRGNALPSDAEIGAVRRWLWAEAGFLALVPVAAALMARGY
jgi:putative membrane protein